MASSMEQLAGQGSSQTDISNDSHTRLNSLPHRTNTMLQHPLPPLPPSIAETFPFEPRPSRASSIVSTRTGLTIGTLHEETRSIRSVDLVFGGQLFHINRDASRISVLEQGDLPPYSPPLHQPSLQIEDAKLSHPTRHSTGNTLIPQRSTDPVCENPASSEGNLVARSPSFNPGPDKISVVLKRRSASQGNIPESAYSPNSPLRRRNGVRLPKIFTSIPHVDDSNSADLTPVDNETCDTRVTRSAGPRMSGDGTHPRSPSYIGANATGKFPGCLQPGWPISPSSSHERPSNHEGGQRVLVPHSPAEPEENHADGTTPPAMDSENDISIHYSRLIRSIDRDHRKALNTRDKELAVMRERLNELDQVYRKELKSRDFTIDDLQRRLQHLEENMQSKIEKVQSELEEQWESRWRVRDRHYMERMRRMELDFQKQLEQAVSDRDAEWAGELKRMNDQLLQNLDIGGGTE